MNYSINRSIFPLLLLITVGILGVGCKVLFGTCMSEDIVTIPSPSGQHEAARYFSNCGATVSYFTDIDIDGKRVVSLQYLHDLDMDIYWEDDNTLVIEYWGNGEDIFRQKDSYKGISIKFIKKTISDR
ncbi:MAG: hypothetical protein QG626_255 [Patescibacteria group bacterium]|nr:hypothetical protein [Patescibacteria group bacterium]MDQ5952128.1 hypothetical protein [Patescibacteria group bacterium]